MIVSTHAKQFLSKESTSVQNCIFHYITNLKEYNYVFASIVFIIWLSDLLYLAPALWWINLEIIRNHSETKVSLLLFE